MTTYEPGTLAVATVRGVPNVRVMRGEGIFSNNWYSNRPVTGSLTSFSDSEVTDVRPLVTLDPEDREQVERLARGNYDRIHKGGAFDDLSDISRTVFTDFMQAALHSLIAPPKPPEPTGLGAVVEDSKGVRWARSGDGAWHDDDGGSVTEFGRIDAVRKLSEGWSE